MKTYNKSIIFKNNTSNLQTHIYIRKNLHLVLGNTAHGTVQQPTTVANTGLLKLLYVPVRGYMPPSPYETEFTSEYQKLLEAARISVMQQHPQAIADAMQRNVSTSTSPLPESRSAMLAQRIADGVENLIETAAAMPSMEESKEPLVPIEKPLIALENVKLAATARIAKSLDSSENISKQKRIWLICSGAVVVGAVTATAIYCFNRKPKR